MINRVVLVGRLAKDPELRYTTNGTAVTTFSVAVDRRFANQNGEREADFINIVTWQKLAEICANYLAKGRQVAIEGRIQTRSYDDKNGNRRWVTEVVAENVEFLGSRDNNQSNNNNNNNNINKSSNGFDDFSSDFGDDIDVPF
jgi:single-strand DNA-binding protein